MSDYGQDVNTAIVQEVADRNNAIAAHAAININTHGVGAGNHIDSQEARATALTAAIAQEVTDRNTAIETHRTGATHTQNQPATWSGVSSKPANLTLISSGNYAGNSTTNRAIAHSLGTTPKLVLFSMRTAGIGRIWRIMESGYIHYLDTANEQRLAVTAMDGTNFYVGNATSYAQSANDANTFDWVAIG